MPQSYTFIGYEPSYGYMHYRDLDTGQALVAEHGQSYRIAATEGPVPGEDGKSYERYPVPPDDGRWAPASSTEGKAARARAKAAAAASANEGAAEDAGSGDTSVSAGDDSTGGSE